MGLIVGTVVSASLKGVVPVPRSETWLIGSKEEQLVQAVDGCVILCLHLSYLFHITIASTQTEEQSSILVVVLSWNQNSP